MEPPRYVGSVQHKEYLSPLGPPALPCDKTACPAGIHYADAVAILTRDIAVALGQGDHSVMRDGDYPRFVWGRSEFPERGSQDAPSETTCQRHVVWEARVTNREKGEYNAYPVTSERHSDSMPAMVRKRLWT